MKKDAWRAAMGPMLGRFFFFRRLFGLNFDFPPRLPRAGEGNVEDPAIIVGLNSFFGDGAGKGDDPLKGAERRFLKNRLFRFKSFGRSSFSLDQQAVADHGKGNLPRIDSGQFGADDPLAVPAVEIGQWHPSFPPLRVEVDPERIGSKRASKQVVQFMLY